MRFARLLLLGAHFFHQVVKRGWVIVWLVCLAALSGRAQSTVVMGVAYDRVTQEKLPFVNVFFQGTQIGVVSDQNGRYTLKTDSLHYTSVEFSYLGYEPLKKNIRPGVIQVLNVGLKSSTAMLKDVEVKSERIRERYKNKNNPAVDMIRLVLSHRNTNRPAGYDYMEYEEYEKLKVSLSTVKRDSIRNKKFHAKYAFLFDNTDTVSLPGFSLIPVYIEETLSDNYLRKSPEKKKKIIRATQRVNFDEFFDTNGVGQYLNYLYQAVDIYEPNVLLLGNMFLSPISDVSPMFYKFYVTDTVQWKGERLYELHFVPRNDADMLFQGRMYITSDGGYAIRRLEMQVNKKVNINWIRGLSIVQDFEELPHAGYQLKNSTIGVDFSLMQKSGGFYGERSVSYQNREVNKPLPSEVYEGLEQQNLSKKNPDENSDFLAKHRHDSLSYFESMAYSNAERLKSNPFFRRSAKLVTLLLSGYQTFRYWELGPVGTFIGWNPVEGVRIKVGGHTLSALHPNIYLSTYFAYGFGDQRAKYFIQGTYSFTGKLPTVFPVRALRFSYRYDTRVPGQELDLVDDNNFLLSIRRGKNDKWVYHGTWELSYQHEFENHLSFVVGLERTVQQPAGAVSFFVSDPIQRHVSSLTSFEASLTVRWAPGEQFYQGHEFRYTIPSRKPEFTLRFVGGIKGFMGAEYAYQNIIIGTQKRFYFSQFGFLDIFLEGGYIFGKIPFPLLRIHRANQTYSYQTRSYNLMNALEFVSDHYLSLQAAYHLNGLLFNKIPFLKKLQLREIFSVKAVYGGLRSENTPKDNSPLFQFPKTEKGQSIIYTLMPSPYLEVGIGIENILKFIRIDVVRRLTYLDHPSVEKWGVRASFRFYF